MNRTRMTAMAMLFTVMAPCVAFAGNVADLTQVGNNVLATSDQIGADNTAIVNQYGDNLKADVDQTGNRNSAAVDQGTAANHANSGVLAGYVSGAVILQQGDDNTASTTWHVGNQGSRISQIGNENDGTQDLSALQGYSVGKYAIDIQQVGNNNQAAQTTTYKYGTYGIQDMLIQQAGNDNIGTQTSLSGQSIGMEILQTGDYNNSVQFQDGMQDVESVKIVGSYNVTGQTQSYTTWGLTTRTATIDIVGDANNATQNQFGVSASADIVIAGNDNIAIQNQTGNNNFAKLTQLGNDNFASQTQTGPDNSSTVSQTGNFNSITVVQAN